MILLDAFPLTLNSVLNILTIVLAVGLGWIVLRFLLRATRLVLTIGCLGLIVVAVVWAVSAYLGRG